MRGATLFSGGGGVEALLKRSIDFVHAVEYDPAIAAVYRQNHGDHIQVARVEDMDYNAWGKLDYLHASPVCKNASQAKTGGVEGDGDLSSAMAVVRCLDATQPRVFTLENVWGYRTFNAFRLICASLDRGGYMWHFEHLNSADFGVPQTRKRLILRAVRDSLLPGWPAPEPWVGWYAAIEDLLPGLPDSKFADWQLARLPETLIGAGLLMQSRTDDGSQHPRRFDEPTYTVCSEQAHPKAFIVAQGCFGDRLVTADPQEPIFTITSNGNQLGSEDGGSVTDRDAAAPYFTVTAACEKAPSRAFLMRSSNTQQEWGDGVPHAVAPAYTVATDSPPKAFLVDCQHTNPPRAEGEERGVNIPDIDAPAQTMLASRSPASYKAWLSQGRVVKMTPHALARFQSLPDSYILPEKAGLACTIIGNCVPSLMMLKIVEPLL